MPGCYGRLFCRMLATDGMIGKVLKIAAFCALFILIAGVSAYFTLSLVIKSEDTVVVPDLVGKDVVFVLEALTELGLNTKVRGSEYSADIPKHHVIHQEPEPGVEIKKGRDVRILISKGTETVPLRKTMQGHPLCVIARIPLSGATSQSTTISAQSLH